MTHPHLVADGKPLPIGKRIGKGGEGEVYLLANDTTQAIKIYTVADGTAREAKISAIIRMGLARQSSLIAFPLAIARDQSGHFKGFVMHLVRDHKPIFELYAPQARKQHFPRASYRFLTHAAINTAKAIAAVHKTGCVIGDINHSGILVSEDAMVALIDADSFQVIDGNNRYLCRVGVPEYTPPELQGMSLTDVVRTANHDAFGLAIAIFQLLTMGRHPFVGAYSKGEITIQRAISEFRFAYSRERSVGMAPPPAVCTLDDFPAFIASAFEAAFGPSQQYSRPSASQWVTLLGEFEQTLQTCKKNALHYYSAAAPACPWCRMEQKLRMVLFLPKDIDLGVFPTSFADTADFNLPLLWVQIEAIKAPTQNELAPTFPSLTLAPSAEAIAAKQKSSRSYALPAAGIVAGIALVIAAPGLWFIALGIAYLAFNLSKGPPDPSATFRQRFPATEDEWNQALDQRERRSGFKKVETLKASLVEAKKAYEALGAEQSNRIKRYQDERETLQKAKFLEKFRIRDHKISGVGPAKLATLTSYGIETAADITPENILRVPGFGPVNSKSLLEWQKKCAGGFSYNSAPTAANQHELNKIKAEIHQRGQALRQKLKSEAQQFAQAVQACRSSLAQGDPLLKDLHTRRSQIEADLNYLGIPLPPRPARPTPRRTPPKSATSTFNVRTPPHPQRAPTATTSPTCPQCRSPMVRRVARRGVRSGKPFWGCSRYPGCRGTRQI